MVGEVVRHWRRRRQGLKLKEKILLAVKILLGLALIASAILKVCELDKFEIYVYSYHFITLNFSFIAARIAIIAELVLGIGLVSNTQHKFYWWGSMGMLLGYTLLLIYALLIGRTDSCHCFGDFLQLDPKQSLLKNVVLVLLLLPVYRVKGRETPHRLLVFCLALAVSTITVFAVSPPDNFTSAYHSDSNLQENLFVEMLNEPPLDSLALQDGKQVVCFFSTGCEYCQMAAQKLALMQQYYSFPAENVICVFMGNDENITRFYEEAQSPKYRSVVYDDDVAKLLKAINGQFPTIVFMRNGAVVETYGFRDMKEAEIKAFFTQP